MNIFNRGKKKKETKRPKYYHGDGLINVEYYDPGPYGWDPSEEPKNDFVLNDLETQKKLPGGYEGEPDEGGRVFSLDFSTLGDPSEYEGYTTGEKYSNMVSKKLDQLLTGKKHDLDSRDTFLATELLENIQKQIDPDKGGEFLDILRKVENSRLGEWSGWHMTDEQKKGAESNLKNFLSENLNVPDSLRSREDTLIDEFKKSDNIYEIGE
jgi:hypothetical protein